MAKKPQSKKNLVKNVTLPLNYVAGNVLSGLAKDHTLVTTCADGKGRKIVANGQIMKFIAVLAGEHLNDPHESYFDPNEPEWEMLDNKPGINYDTRPWVLREFGLFWVGLPGMREVEQYKFAWTEPKPNTQTTEPWDRDECTDFFYVSEFPYLLVLDDLLTADDMKVRVTIQVNLRITNPYLAFARGTDWYQRAKAYVLEVTRNYVGQYSYQQLLSETNPGPDEQTSATLFCRRIEELTRQTMSEDGLQDPKGLKGKIGVSICSAQYLQTKLSGALAAQNEELTLAQARADAEKIAKETAAKAQANSIEMVSTAEAAATKRTGEAANAVIAGRLEAQAKHSELAIAEMNANAIGKAGTTIVLGVDAGLKELAAAAANAIKKTGT